MLEYKKNTFFEAGCIILYPSFLVILGAVLTLGFRKLKGNGIVYPLGTFDAEIENLNGDTEYVGEVLIPDFELKSGLRA